MKSKKILKFSLITVLCAGFLSAFSLLKLNDTFESFAHVDDRPNSNNDYAFEGIFYDRYISYLSIEEGELVSSLNDLSDDLTITSDEHVYVVNSDVEDTTLYFDPIEEDLNYDNQFYLGFQGSTIDTQSDSPIITVNNTLQTPLTLNIYIESDTSLMTGDSPVISVSGGVVYINICCVYSQIYQSTQQLSYTKVFEMSNTSTTKPIIECDSNTNASVTVSMGAFSENSQGKEVYAFKSLITNNIDGSGVNRNAGSTTITTSDVNSELAKLATVTTSFTLDFDIPAIQNVENNGTGHSLEWLFGDMDDPFSLTEDLEVSRYEIYEQTGRMNIFFHALFENYLIGDYETACGGIAFDPNPPVDCEYGWSMMANCPFCNVDETFDLPPQDHQFVERTEITTEAGCTTPGEMTSYRECLVCGTREEGETSLINPHGHEFSEDWTIDAMPTFENGGTASHHCEFECGATDGTLQIPQLVSDGYASIYGTEYMPGDFAELSMYEGLTLSSQEDALNQYGEIVNPNYNYYVGSSSNLTNLSFKISQDSERLTYNVVLKNAELFYNRDKEAAPIVIDNYNVKLATINLYIEDNVVLDGDGSECIRVQSGDVSINVRTLKGGHFLMKSENSDFPLINTGFESSGDCIFNIDYNSSTVQSVNGWYADLDKDIISLNYPNTEEIEEINDIVVAQEDWLYQLEVELSGYGEDPVVEPTGDANYIWDFQDGYFICTAQILYNDEPVVQEVQTAMPRYCEYEQYDHWGEAGFVAEFENELFEPQEARVYLSEVKIYKKTQEKCDHSSTWIYANIDCRELAFNNLIDGNTQEKGRYEKLYIGEIFEEQVEYTATCEEAGTQHWYRSCACCGALIEDFGIEQCDALGHDFHEWDDNYSLDIVPTTTTPGKKSHHCIRCGKSLEDWVEVPVCSEDSVKDVAKLLIPEQDDAEKSIRNDSSLDSLANNQVDQLMDIVGVIGNTYNDVEQERAESTATGDEAAALSKYTDQVNILNTVAEAVVIVSADQPAAKSDGEKIDGTLPSDFSEDESYMSNLLNDFYQRQIDIMLGRTDMPEGNRNIIRSFKEDITVPQTPNKVNLNVTAEEYGKMVDFVDESTLHMKSSALQIRKCSGEKIRTNIGQYITKVSISSFRRFDKEQADREFVENVHNAMLLNMQGRVLEILRDNLSKAKNKSVIEQYENEIAACEDIEQFEIIVTEVLRRKYVALTGENVEDLDYFKENIYWPIFRAWALNEDSPFDITLEQLTDATIEETTSQSERLVVGNKPSNREIAFVAAFGGSIALVLVGAWVVPMIIRKRKYGGLD